MQLDLGIAGTFETLHRAGADAFEQHDLDVLARERGLHTGYLCGFRGYHYARVSDILRHRSTGLQASRLARSVHSSGAPNVRPPPRSEEHTSELQSLMRTPS